MSEISEMKARIHAVLTDANTPLADCKTAAETLKALGDYEKATGDATNQPQVLRFEAIRSFSTGIVPLLTLFTLAITIYFQWAQAQITDRANEDARWRTVAEAMAKPPGPTTNPLVVTSIAPFYLSERYGSQAYELTFLLMNSLAHSAAFQSMFRLAFGNASWGNIHDMRRLSDILSANYYNIDTDLQMLGSSNEPGTSDARLAAPRPDILLMATRARREVLAQRAFLANEVGKLLKGQRPASATADFSNFAFYEANLSKVDFTGLDMRGAEFQRADLDGAILRPKSFEGSVWIGTKWWAAAEIDPVLLLYLIANAAPYVKIPDEIFPPAEKALKIDRAEYMNTLGVLCTRSGAQCDLKSAPFGTPKE